MYYTLNDDLYLFFVHNSCHFHFTGCKKQGRAYKYAVKSKKNHGNGTRRVPKYK